MRYTSSSADGSAFCRKIAHTRPCSSNSGGVKRSVNSGWSPASHGRRSICAVRDTYLGRLSSAAYDQLLTRFPQEVMRIFATRIARRVQQITAGTLRASSRVNNIALIPASPGGGLQALLRPVL